MRIGYARVSTVGQNPEAQIAALQAAGCDRTYTDRASGTTTARPELHRALDTLRTGDEFVVWRLDRLGRSLPDLVGLLVRFQERGVTFRSLTEGIDTSTPLGQCAFIMAGWFAQCERDIIRERTLVGQAQAAAAGKHGGRTPSLTPAKLRRALRMLSEGEAVAAVAELVGVSRAALYRHPATRAAIDERRSKANGLQ